MEKVQGYCTELACWQRAEECPLHATSGSPGWLDVAQRPADVREAIQKAFDSIVGETRSNWGLYNGWEKYRLARLEDYALARALITAHAGTQKEFVFLDIGAGNFEWGRGLVAYLRQSGGLPEGVSVHVIGVRGESSTSPEVHGIGVNGESSTDPEVIKKSPYKIYELGAFKVEELSSQLRGRGLADLAGKVDLVVSRWCFRHLVDPVGTFVQTVNLLRPRKGLFVGDGFFHLRQNDESPLIEINHNRRVVQMLADTNIPFLIKSLGSGHGLYEFVLQRANDQPCRLEMSYKGVVQIDRNHWDVGSGCITQFDRAPQPEDETTLFKAPFRIYGEMCVKGNRDLYQWLQERHLFWCVDDNEMYWTPLYERERSSTPRELLPLEYPKEEE